MISLKKDLSNMLCHSEKTAERSYFLEEKTKNVAKTFTEMKETMRRKRKADVPEIDGRLVSVF